jgi:O-antigen/teichoic acid export membrane protein
VRPPLVAGSPGVRPLRDLVRHTLIYGFGSVGTSLISFVLIPLYTRYLSPGDYGVLALVLVAQGVLTRFYDLGLTNAVGRFFFDYDAGRDRRGLGQMVSTTGLFLLAYGGVLSTVIYASASRIAAMLVGSADLAPLVRVLALTLLLEALSIPALTLIRMEERSALWVTISTLRVIGSLALNIYFVVFAGMGVMGVLVSNALTAGAVLLGTAVPLMRRAALSFRPDLLRRMLSFGLPFLPVLLGIVVIDLSDRYLLQWLRSTEEVGIYAVGSKFGQVMMIAVSAFSLGWAPLRYRIFERADAKAVYVRILGLFVSVSALGVVVLSVFGDEAVRLATTPAYYGGARVIPLIAASYALYGVHLLVATGMGVTKKTSGLAGAVVLATGVNLASNLALIPRYGMMGAAAATLLAYLVLVAATHRSSQAVYAIDYDWGRVALIALAATSVIWADRLLQPEPIAGGIAVGSAFALLFAALVVLIGGVHASDVRALGLWVSELRGERRTG